MFNSHFLIDKYLQHGKDLYYNFNEFKAAFDEV